MAEGTRLKDLQESLKKLDQLLQTESMKRAASELKIQEQRAGIDKKYEHLTTTLADIQLQLLNLGKGTGSGEGSVLGNYEKSFGFGKHGSNPNFAHSPLPIIDFPRFDGSNPRGWILKCNSYFKLIPEILDSHKVNLATMHFDGKALSWFQNLNMDQFDITWEQFLEVVSARFEDMRVSNIIVEFNKLKHTDSYDDYVEHFNELKACMVLDDQSKYSEDYFIASFVSGLSEELRSFIHMFQPKTLHQTIELGRKQLTTLEAITKRLLPSSQPYHNPPNTYKKTETLPNLPYVPALDSNTKSNSPPIKLLTSAEMAARRDKGLCYNCDEKYVFGHRCTKRVNYVMMTETEELIASKEFADLELQEVETNMVQHIDEVHISLHSIMGEGGITTMRVVGEVGLHKLDVLLDTGSTLSFINETTKHVQRTVEENADYNIPSTSYALVPLKSNGVEGAGRRSGNLEKRPLKDRSSESNMVAVRQKSTFQLTPSMLRGQALRSMEEASTSELLHSVQDDHNIEASAGFMDADDHTSQDQGKVEEDGPVENAFPSDTHYPINNSDSAVSFEADIVRGRTSDDLEVGLSEPQNKAAFRMSVLEDYVDLDDDLPNEVALRPPSEEREPFVAHLKNSKFSPLEEPKRSEACSEPELKSPSDLILSKANEASTAVAVSLGERSNGIINPASEEVTAAAPLSIPPPSVAALDKPKEIPQSLFSFSPNVADKFPSLMPESNSRTPESSSSLVDVFAPTSSSVIVPESERGGFLKPLALAAEDTNGKSDSVTSAASNGLLVSVAPFGSFTATSNNNTHQISTSPVIFTPSVTVSDSIPSGNGSITSDPSSKVSFRTSETPKVSGEPPLKFGISSNPTTSQPTNAAAPVTFNSFSSAPASVFSSPSPSLSQPVFGNNFQMNGEDSMAEDPVQSTAPTPSLPAFGQPNASPSPPGFMFGSTTVQPQANPFQFGGQQNNQGAPQNPSVFQASGSLGGSFSLGSGGGDKSSRKFVKANRNKNRKK